MQVSLRTIPKFHGQLEQPFKESSKNIFANKDVISFGNGKTTLLFKSGSFVNKIPVIRNVIPFVAKTAKKVIAYVVSIITGAAVLAHNVGDDIKMKSKVKINPVSLAKDAGSKVRNKVISNIELHAANQKETSIIDVVKASEDALSNALGIDIGKSSKKIVINAAEEKLNNYPKFESIIDKVNNLKLH